MAKRGMVWFGLSGPVTQPTIDVPGGAVDGAGSAAGAGAWLAAAGVCAVALPGDGVTAACFCTCPELGRIALRRPSRPNLGSGAWSLAPTGLWPIGRSNGAIADGLGIW